MTTSPDALYFDDRLGEYRVAVAIDGLQDLHFGPAGKINPMTASVTTHTASPMNLTTTVLLDGETNNYAAIACPSATQCTASTGGGQLVTFDPRSPSDPTTSIQLASGVSVTALACPSTSQCTAILPSLSSAPVPGVAGGTGNVAEGSVVTFDPNSASVPTATLVDPDEPLTELSCPSTALCVAADALEDMFAFDPTSPASTIRSNHQRDTRDGPTVGLSCPSITQCTAITSFTTTLPSSNAYQEYAIDPSNFEYVGAGGQSFVLSRTMNVVACPAVRQCTIVDNTGTEYTFPPLSNPVDIDGGAPLADIPIVLPNANALACPTTNQCTILAGGQQETFDPISGVATGTLDLGNSVLSLACPTVSQCTAVDNVGQQVTFDPTASVVLDGADVQAITSHSLIGSRWAITSTITGLPSSIDFSVSPGKGRGLTASYSATSSIPMLTIDASGLPVSQFATEVHVEIDGIPRGMVLDIPATGGNVSFSPCSHPGNCTDQVVKRVLAEVYGGTTPASLPNIHDQGIVFNEISSQLTVSLSKVGSFTVSESGSPLTLDYQISSTALNIDLTLGQLINPDPVTAKNPVALATYLDAQISNPAPNTEITLSPTNAGAQGVYLSYYAGAPINQIELYTNADGSYFDGVLENLPQNLTICADTSPNGSPCNLYCPSGDILGTYDSGCVNLPVPDGWIAPRTGAGWDCFGFGTETAPCPGPADGYEVYKTGLAWLQILPTDGSGNPPSTPMTVDVFACPGATTFECTTDSPVNGVAGAYPATLLVEGLKFSTLELAIGGGSISGENYGWLGIDTDPTLGLHVDQVSAWLPGQQTTSGPAIQITNTNGGKGGVFADRFAVFGEQNGAEVKVFTTDVGAPGSPGSWECVNPLNLDVLGEDISPLFGC